MATDRPSPRRREAGHGSLVAGQAFQWPRIGRHLGARGGKWRLALENSVSMATDRPSPRRLGEHGWSGPPDHRFNGHGSAVTSAPVDAHVMNVLYGAFQWPRIGRHLGAGRTDC